MLVVGVKSNLGCEAGCGVTVSFSDHSRIILGSFSEWSRNGLGMVSDRSRIVIDVSSVLEKCF